MEINRSNYEIWLIDYLDGNLDPDQIVLLENFLKMNPDIDQEKTLFKEIYAVPELKIYPYKNSLIKNSSELSDNQFNYLCVAYGEHDLSDAQVVELLEIVANNPSRAKIFNTYNKVKLYPAKTGYSNKNRLKKLGISEKPVFRIVLAGLSIAASIAVFFLIFNNLREEKASNTAIIGKMEIQVPETQKDSTIEIKINIPQQSENKLIVGNSIENINEYKKNMEEYVPPVSEDQKIAMVVPKDTVIKKLLIPDMFYNINMIIATPVQTGTLLAMNNRAVTPEVVEEPKGLKNYITNLLRDKILKNKNTETGPLKGYEIADAGIIGLNKLLGWEMSLEKTTDTNREESSLVFNSLLLKYSTPVKYNIAEQ
jgi:hypothetical protein